MKWRVMVTLFAQAAFLSTPGSASAHHSFEGQFDASRVLHLQGIVTRVEMMNPHSYIHLEVRRADGVDRWALEGPSAFNLKRRGLEQAVQAGDSLGVCGYAAKRQARPAGTGRVAHAPRRLSAAVLTLPGGHQQLWENYRQGKCQLDR